MATVSDDSRVSAVKSSDDGPVAVVSRPPLLFIAPRDEGPPAMCCGRTAQNNTPLEALVFHQTLSTPKASYIGWIPSSTPKGELE